MATAGFPAVEIQSHRGERRRRIELLNTWLAGTRVTVNDWDGEGFSVEDASGRRRIASDLSTLWPAVEALAGHPFDPLADDLPYGSR
ncbi:MAG TPA: hypothetical protein VJP86_06035 [Vicinamibacterales bacterium]|nr:hypothetical protein [Vicinamibacterales bacterium]